MSIVVRSVCVFIVASMSLFSQSVTVRPTAILFDTSLTTVHDSVAVWIKNPAAAPVTVTDINSYHEVFTVRDTAFVIPAGDSVRCWVKFYSSHNLTFQSLLFVETEGTAGSAVVPVSGTKKYAEVLYAATQGKSGEPLKTALNTIMKTGYITLGYNTGRDRMFMNIDNHMVNGQGASTNTLECVYTGRQVTGYSNRSDAQTNGNFNTEHTWPQSKFNSVDPMQSDLHHLFPTDEGANSKRSNYPFGVVITSSWTSGGSKYGNGLGGQIVFEPRDEHKGNCARTMFYFVLRHANHGNFWTESPYQETAFRDWHKKFPPTAQDKKRNDLVQQYQGNRNPFVDHPELVDRINNFGGTATIVTAPALAASPQLPVHPKVSAGQSTGLVMTFANVGSAAATVTSALFSNPAYSLAEPIGTIDVNAYKKISVSYQPTSPQSDSLSTLTVTYNDGKTVVITIRASSIPVSVKNSVRSIPSTLVLEQNFPNPFNPSTTIRYSLPEGSFVRLTVYDITGREVATVVNQFQNAGQHTAEFDASTLTSGMYYYTITAGNYSETKKMVVMK